MDTRQNESNRVFKRRLAANIAYNNCDTTANKPRPEFYSFGDRYTNFIHTKLHHNNIDSPLCSCGKAEDTFHFFICTHYSALRNEILMKYFVLKTYYCKYSCSSLG